MDDGLSGGVVRAVLQDAKGFLWIGTHDGLNMYDGFRVTGFRHDPDDDNSLPGSYITSLAETRGPSGVTLWVGTFRGLAAFEPATGRVTRYSHDPRDETTLSHDAVQALLLDRDGALWVGTSGGLNRLDTRTGRFTRFPHVSEASNSLTDSFVTALEEDQNGDLWVGTANGLNRLRAGSLRITRFEHDRANSGSINHPYIRSLRVDTRGRLWVGTDRGGLDRFDPASNRFVHHVRSPAPGSIGGNAVNAILEDAAGDIWIGTWGGGINRLVERNGRVRFDAFRHDPANPHSLPVDDVTMLAQDRSGVIWVGTYGGGVSGFAPAVARRFPHYHKASTDPQSLADDRVYGLLVDRSRTLWVGTWGGLSYRRKGMSGFTHLRHDPADASTISHDRVTGIAEGPDGAIWASTMDAGLNRVDPVTTRIVRFRHDPGRGESPAGDRMLAVRVDRAGTVWCGTLYHGLCRLNSDGSFTTFASVATDPTTLSSPRVNGMFEDSRRRFWLATHAGLDLFDRATGRVTRVHQLPGAPASLSRPVSEIAETPDGRLWIGTIEDGVVSLTWDGTGPLDVRSYREKDGLSNDRVYRIIPEHGQRLWISTARGLTALEVQSQGMRRYDAADGLQSNQFLSGGFYDEGSGTVLVGGIRGFNTFRPAALGPEAPPVPVVLTDFLVRNERVRVDEDAGSVRIADAAEVTVPYSSQMFSLEFAALDFTAPQKTTYAYMLEGFDRQWNYTGAERRFATYTSLSPGRYLFKLRAANRDGVWTPAPLTLPIVIAPPFWMTWWFRALVVLGLALSIVLAVRVRLAGLGRQRRLLEAQVSARTAELQQANAAKTTFLANMSHEMRTPLSALVGLADVLRDTPLDEEQTEYVRALAAAGEALSELVDDTLDLRKIELGRFELECAPFDLRRLVDDTMQIVNVRAAQKGLACSSAVAPDVPRSLMGDARALRRVLMNLLANAVKFTDRGAVSLTVGSAPEADAPRLRFTVSDTGIGIAPDRQTAIFETFVQADVTTARRYGGSGLGLALSRQLAELMGGRIDVESSPGEGSRFHLVVPSIEADLPSAVVPGEDRRAVKARLLRILIVEDAAQIRLLLKAYFQGSGDVLHMVDSGEEGIAAFRDGRFDVVLMDVNLPGMSGYEATAELRRLERLEGRPPSVIIAITAFAFREDAERSRAAGCDHHLTKPIRKAVLLELLDRCRGTHVAA